MRGLRDDTTCLIVDIAPPGSRIFAPALKKSSSFMKLLRCTQPQEIHITEDYVMEELFEETSAALPERQVISFKALKRWHYWKLLRFLPPF